MTILHNLHSAGGPVRFRQLQRQVEPITQKGADQAAPRARTIGLVAREVFAEVPPRVEYRLTDLGGTLIPALAGLHEWAGRYASVVDENRRIADEARAKAEGIEVV